MPSTSTLPIEKAPGHPPFRRISKRKPLGIDVRVLDEYVGENAAPSKITSHAFSKRANIAVVTVESTSVTSRVHVAPGAMIDPGGGETFVIVGRVLDAPRTRPVIKLPTWSFSAEFDRKIRKNRGRKYPTKSATRSPV